MTRVNVDRKLCENHGQCAIAAPAVFWMNDDSELEYEYHPDGNVLADLEEAQDVCPVQAIFIIED